MYKLHQARLSAAWSQSGEPEMRHVLFSFSCACRSAASEPASSLLACPSPASREPSIIGGEHAAMPHDCLSPSAVSPSKRGRSRKHWIYDAFDEQGSCRYCHRLISSPNISVKKVRHGLGQMHARTAHCFDACMHGGTLPAACSTSHPKFNYDVQGMPAGGMNCRFALPCPALPYPALRC